MKVAAVGLPTHALEAIASWGWQLTGQHADATLSAAGDFIEIRTEPGSAADDIVFLPLNQQELKTRIERAKARQARLAKRLHDLRSPLNAIQGYAEIITETAEGDVLRFASNIRTASDLLTNRLQSLQEEGV